MGPPKVSNTCDECKARKVRCAKVPNSDLPMCHNCKNRGLVCHFGLKKPRAKRAPPYLPRRTDSPRNSAAESLINNNGMQSTPSNGTMPAALEDKIRHEDSPQSGPFSAKTYVDVLLEGRSTAEEDGSEGSIFKPHNQHIGSSGIAIFSEQRLASISNRLGHGKFDDIIDTLSNAFNIRMNRSARPSASRIKFRAPSTPLRVSNESARIYITAFFNHTHPIYPFLDQTRFEEKALHGEVTRLIQESPPFSALYHTVLALGCQYHGGGSFESGVGAAWQLFQVALGLFPELIIPKETLANVQAVTAMAIFARNSSCVQIGNMLTAEAARMAQSISLHRAIYEGENMTECQQTFWVICILEKTLSFACNKDSMLVDSAIATPVPNIPAAVFGTFNWLHTMCRFSRLISKLYTDLFTISASSNHTGSKQLVIDTYRLELEAWKMSIPEEFRPGNLSQPLDTLEATGTTLAVMLRIHYHYYSIAIALARLDWNLSSKGLSSRPAIESELTLLQSACRIIELTHYIDIETYTPIWVLLSVPVSAVFLIFDFIIHHPAHPETRRHLSLLGMAVGYFCRLEYVSGGALQLSLLSNIFQIARSYVHQVECGLAAGENGENDAVPIQEPTAPPMDMSQGSCTVLEHTNPASGQSDSYGLFGDASVFENHVFPETIDLMDLFTTAIPESFDPF